MRRVASPARLVLLGAVLATSFLLAAAEARGHAEIVPSTMAMDGDLLTLTVPNERDGDPTRRVVLTVPDGLSVGPFVEAPGWTRRLQAADGGGTERVTWTAEGNAGADGGVFQFVARAESSDAYVVPVAQVYSSGAVVEWAGAVDSDEPAPIVEAKSSRDGGTSALALAALILAGAAVALAVIALVRQASRDEP